MFADGARYDCTFMVFFWAPNGSQDLRAGYSVSRRVGKACKRNLIKRWLRNSFHQILSGFAGAGSGVPAAGGIDFVVKVRPDILKRGYREVYGRFLEFLGKAMNRRENVEN